MTTPRRATQQQQKYILLVYELLLWGNRFLYLYNKTFERNLIHTEFKSNSVTSSSLIIFNSCLPLLLTTGLYWSVLFGLCIIVFFSRSQAFQNHVDTTLFRTLLSEVCNMCTKLQKPARATNYTLGNYLMTAFPSPLN